MFVMKLICEFGRASSNAAQVGPRVGYPPPVGSLTVLPRRLWAGLRGPLHYSSAEVVE
jgi:hypothetical protein